MLLRFQMQTPVLLGRLAVPFLNSLRILEKGTAFLLEFSESYQLFFQIGRSIRELDALRCSGFFCFQKVFILRIDRSE